MNSRTVPGAVVLGGTVFRNVTETVPRNCDRWAISPKLGSERSCGWKISRSGTLLTDVIEKELSMWQWEMEVASRMRPNSAVCIWTDSKTSGVSVVTVSCNCDGDAVVRGRGSGAVTACGISHPPLRTDLLYWVWEVSSQRWV